MFRHTRLAVSGYANEYRGGTILTGTADRKKVVHGILCAEATAAKNNDAVIKVWIGQQLIAEVPFLVFLDCDEVTNPLLIGEPWIPIGVELPEGEELTVGIDSGSTASDFEFVAQWEYKEA